MLMFDFFNSCVQIQRSLEYANFRKERYDLYFKDAVIEDYASEDVRRQLNSLKNLGSSALSDEDLGLVSHLKPYLTCFNKMMDYNVLCVSILVHYYEERHDFYLQLR